MRFLAVLGLLSIAVLNSAPHALGAPTSSVPQEGSTALELLMELRGLKEQERDAELVGRGESAVQPGAALAGSGEAIVLVARALFDIGREEAAEALLESAAPGPETKGWVQAERAWLALQRDDLVLALRRLGRRTDTGFELHHPEHPDGWLLTAQVFARGGEGGQAERFAERFVALAPLHPEAPVAWHLMQMAAARRGDVQRARECAAEKERWSTWHAVVKARRFQIQQAPDAPEPRFGLALAWMEAERFDRAAEVLDELLQRVPDWCRAWFHLGEARRRSGQTQEALAAFDQGVDCDGDHKSLFQRAELRWQMGKRDLARADFETLLATPTADDPLFAALHLRLAQHALAAGEAANARAHYGKYTALGGREPLE